MTTTVNINSALKINVTPIESGASGGVLFQKSDGKLGQSSNLHWDETNSRLSIGQGTAPVARLDVRAQGVLSTDIAFRVRNSGNTRNFLVVNGAGDVFNNGAGGVTSNTFYGEDVGRSASGTGNTLFGSSSGKSITTGGNNTFFGFNTGFAITTETGNTFIGTRAGQSTTTSSNTFIGSSSGINNTTGARSVLVGIDSGRFASDGTTLITIINDSVLIGSSSKPESNNQTNQIVIGHNAIGTGSNSVTLGNTSITRTNLRGQIVISGFAASPVGVEGAIYYDTVLKKHYGFNGTNWNALY